MVAIGFIKEKDKIKVDYVISDFNLKNTFEICSLCKDKTQKVYVIELFKNSNLSEQLIYCAKCLENQLKYIKQNIYNTDWDTLIFQINNFKFVIEKTNLLKARCDFCYSLYTRFKIKLYPIGIENKLCLRCFRDKLERIL